MVNTISQRSSTDDDDIVVRNTKPKLEESFSLPPIGKANNSVSSSECLVCQQIAHGVHFGVLTCRACAAFFRRTAVLSRSYPCRKGNGNCEISQRERYLCRQCRYTKCLKLGMTPENVQLNRDPSVILRTKEGKTKKSSKDEQDLDPEPQVVPLGPSPPNYLSSSSSTDSPEDSSIKSQRRSSEDTPTPSSSSHGMPPLPSYKKIPTKEVLETREMIPGQIGALRTLVRNVFDTFNADLVSPLSTGTSPLTRMHYALMWIRRNQRSELTVLTHMNMITMNQVYQYKVLTSSEFFMFCEEFAALPKLEKVRLFYGSWAQFYHLERLHMSIVTFGRQFLVDRYMVMTDDHAANIHRLQVDYSAISDYDNDYIKSIMCPVENRLYEEVAKPMLDMELTDLEVTYMMCQLAFHTEGRDEKHKLSEQTIDACIAFRNRLSDDLHNYYTTVLRQPNYANRVINMMRICETMEKIQAERKKMMDLAMLFDIITHGICGGGPDE